LKLEDVRLVHAIPGRIRFKLDGIKGNPDQMSAVESRLATVRGMHHVEASSLTGSVVATFDPALLESLDFHFAIAHALGISPSDLSPDYLAKWYAKDTNGAQNPLKDVTEHWRLLVPFALLVLGIRGVLIADKLTFPQWYDYFWFAFGTYFALNPSSPSVARMNEEAS
jgi:hypothetical protein